jgi:hypothetical protein
MLLMEQQLDLILGPGIHDPCSYAAVLHAVEVSTIVGEGVLMT